MKIILDERETALYNAICEKKQGFSTEFDIEKKVIVSGIFILSTKIKKY